MKDDGSVLAAAVSSNKRTDITNEKENSNSIASTAKPPMNYSKKGDLYSKNHQTAKKLSSMVRNPSGPRGKSHLHFSHIKPYTMKRFLTQTLLHKSKLGYTVPHIFQLLLKLKKRTGRFGNLQHHLFQWQK